MNSSKMEHESPGRGDYTHGQHMKKKEDYPGHGKSSHEGVRAEGCAMKLLQTQDKHLTLLHPELGESYHPVTGVMKHAEMYAASCELPARILDIGFGLGFCAAAVVQRAMREQKNVELVGVEADNRILHVLPEMRIPSSLEEGYAFIRKAALQGIVEQKGISVSLLQGDARKVVGDASGKFDAVFLDGFSVMKNPELYSEDFLRLLKTRMQPEGILVSWSNSMILRGGLRAAGFCVGSYQRGTRAGLQQQFQLDEKEERVLRAFGKPFRDPELNWRRERILEEWGGLPMVFLTS